MSHNSNEENWIDTNKGSEGKAHNYTCVVDGVGSTLCVGDVVGGSSCLYNKHTSLAGRAFKPCLLPLALGGHYIVPAAFSCQLSSVHTYSSYPTKI